MFNERTLNRRTALKTAGASAAAAVIASCVKADGKVEDYQPKGNLKQSVCAWCYRLPPAELAAQGAKMGLKSVELLFAKQFLTCLITVAWKLQAPRHYRLACVAEELAFRALVQRAADATRSPFSSPWQGSRAYIRLRAP